MLILKCIVPVKETREMRAILKKKKKVGGHTLTNFEISYEATVINIFNLRKTILVDVTE